jgi:hypothetical protein
LVLMISRCCSKSLGAFCDLGSIVLVGTGHVPTVNSDNDVVGVSW